MQIIQQQGVPMFPCLLFIPQTAQIRLKNILSGTERRTRQNGILKQSCQCFVFSIQFKQ